MLLSEQDPAPNAAAISSTHHHPHQQQQQQSPHALVLPVAAQGHINPMMHLSLKLARDHGFAITFVVTQHHLPSLRAFLARHGPGLPVRLAHFPDTRARRSIIDFPTARDFSLSFACFVPEIAQLLESLLIRGRTTPPPPAAASSLDAPDPPSQIYPPISLLIADLFLHFTLDIAAKFNVPALAFWPMSAGNLASVMAINQGHRPNADDPSELVRWIPGVPPLKRTEINDSLQCYDPTDPIFTEVYMKAYRRFACQKTYVVLNTFEELEHESLEALRLENPNMFVLGPLLPPHVHFNQGSLIARAVAEDANYSVKLSEPSLQDTVRASWAEDRSCLGWLDRQAPRTVLYVSFGSFAVLTTEQFEELVLGVEASGCPFLWVVRPDLLPRDEASKVGGRLEGMREVGRACVVEWAPQLEVLAHGAVGGFLTHCGWNSVMEGIAAGVPMLGWPYFVDQMLNSRCCVDAWGVGLAFDSEPPQRGAVGREEVERKVRELMAPASALRERAGWWREAARRALSAEEEEEEEEEEEAAAAGGACGKGWRELMEAINNACLPACLPSTTELTC